MLPARKAGMAGEVVATVGVKQRGPVHGPLLTFWLKTVLPDSDKVIFSSLGLEFVGDSSAAA